jgi:hypothetical protein
LGLWAGDFALWLAATTFVSASLNISKVVTDHVVDIFLRVFGGSLKLRVSKDDALTYDFKRGRHLKAHCYKKEIKFKL